MDIVILGYAEHPFTKAFLKECQERGIAIKALVQALRLDYPPELVLGTLMSDGFTRLEIFRQAVSINNFKRAFRNPGFALSFLARLLGKKSKHEETQAHPARVLKANADMKGLLVKSVSNFNSKDSQRLLRELSPDLIVLAPAAQLIKRAILKIPKIGTLNAHPGLLPAYRGMHVVEYSILNGDPLGLTVHFVDEGVDTGDIIFQRPLRVSPGDTLDSFLERELQLAIQALVDAIELIKNRKYQRKPQDKSAGKQYYPIHPALLDIARVKLQEYVLV